MNKHSSVKDYILRVLEEREAQVYEKMQRQLDDIDASNIMDIYKLDNYYDLSDMWFNLSRTINYYTIDDNGDIIS